MRFFIAKNDEKVCTRCKSQILRGEEYTRVYAQKKKGRYSFVFHIECYKLWVIESFDKKYKTWLDSLKPRNKRGRPQKYINGASIHRLKSLIRYHKTVGNLTRVAELEEELTHAIS